jgi:hypothetical protein
MRAVSYLATAFLTGLFGLLVSAAVAIMAVEWYRVSQFEGEAGFFVFFLALLGFAASVALALIVCALVAKRRGGFWGALGLSLALVAGIGGVGGGLIRVLADVPPELDGEHMLLALEFRWPASRVDPPTATGADDPAVHLYSIPFYSNVVRAREEGPLWLGDAQRVDGRWIAPAAVSIFTSRGTRMVSIDTAEGEAQGFELPLPSSPGRKDLEWSEWLPRLAPGVAAPPDMLNVRYRAVKVSQPIRRDTMGAFVIGTATAGFYRVRTGERLRFAAGSQFVLRYRGQPVLPGATIDDLAVVSAPRAAMLVHVDASESAERCYLVAEADTVVRIEPVADCFKGHRGWLLTSDAAAFGAARDASGVPGWIDRDSYSRPGLYLLGSSVIDTRALTVRHFSVDADVSLIPSVPPLGLSPDDRSFVRFVNSGGPNSVPLILVIDTFANRAYTLPVSPARMRYAKLEALDPAWLTHHFHWQRGADGVDILAERADFVPLPYRGEVSVERDGYRTYRLEKGTEALRDALVDFLVAEFGAERPPAEAGAYEVPTIIAGRTVNVAFSSNFGYVAVSMPRGSTDTSPVAAIGERFDAALATGRYDSLFGN